MAEERIEVEVDSEGLEAFIRVARGEPMEPEAVKQALAAAEVSYGIDEQVLGAIESRIHDENFEAPEQTIARGKAPRHGKDGAIELEITIGPLAFTRRGDGSLDWFERCTLTRVAEGDELGFVRPPTDGRPGTSVDGSELPATPGKPQGSVLGDGVELTDKARLIARRSGAAMFKNGNQLDVLEHVEHSGDVDMKSGNLETDGSLTITGNVNTNLEVTAKGDVEIKGAVFGGRVDAGGSLRVARGITAGESGVVDVGGDLVVHHAQMASLRAGGQVVFATDSVGNQIHARSLEVGKRLFGGTATVETLIRTHEAGAKTGAGTRLRVAEPFTSAREEAHRKAELHKERRKISQGKQDGGSERHSRKKKGKRGRERMAIDRKETQHKREHAAARRALMEVAEIQVPGIVNVGVQIRFGSRRMNIDKAMRATRFTFDPEAKRIIVSDL
ncbi:MAG: FapA family protein [Myxococcota bacterium]|nr:FapA family protein [Myxococcota bacterium]